MNYRTLLLLLGLTATAAQAQGQKSSPVTLTLQQSLVTTVKDGGKEVERLVPNPKEVLPGATLSQVITARNVSARSMNKVVVKLPIRKGTVYVGQEKLNTTSYPTEYSIDGGKTFSANPKRKVTVTENGKQVTREVVAAPSEYNAVRWTIPTLQAKTERKVGIRVRVR